jgi:hypothetical protein
MKKIPSKEEIKAKYGISNDDFEILTEIPTPEDVACRMGFLEKVTDAFGFKTWMVSSVSGLVLFVIFLVPEAVEKYEFWKGAATKAYTSFEFALANLDENPSETDIELVPFARQTQVAMIGKPTPPMGDYPPATGILPQLPSPPPSPSPGLV